jgi:AraC-like DNA-binding protein
MVDVDTAVAPGFALAHDKTRPETEWHRHQRHQLLYASSGMLELHVDGSLWLLPPRRMAWLGAGTLHRVRAHPATRLVAAYLHPVLVPAPAFNCRVFAAAPVAREMLLHAIQWTAERAQGDALAARFFEVLATVCLRAATLPEPFRLPEPETDTMKRVTEWVSAHLGANATMQQCASATKLSVRTLSRRFETELGMGYREYLQTARMTQAMDLLGTRSTNVTEAAFAVGFSSVGAFSKAFKEFTGESPSTYRRRVFGKLD